MPKTSNRKRYTVRVTRDDGSVTFKCDRVSESHAIRERDAWRAEGWEAEIVNVKDARVELRAWRAAVRETGRYYPQEEK